jgi:hypothetical protein
MAVGGDTEAFRQPLRDSLTGRDNCLTRRRRGAGIRDTSGDKQLA